MTLEIVTLLDESPPGTPVTLTLRKRGDAYDLLLGSVILLSSAALETERAFGQLAADLAPAPASGPAQRLNRVVIGGLGFGATVRGVLEVAPADARILVVEKLHAVEKLVRGDLAHLAAGALDDPRVEVVCADVVDVIERESAIDVLLLDVDNGPNWASFRTNARLYGPHGLLAAARALAPGGALAVWSGYAADAFLPKLRAAGLTPSVELLRERGVVRARAYIGKKTFG